MNPGWEDLVTTTIKNFQNEQAKHAQSKTRILAAMEDLGKVQFNANQIGTLATKTLFQVATEAMLSAREVREPWGFDCGCQSCGSMMPLEGGLCCQKPSYLPLREFCANPSLRCLFYEKNGWELPEKLS
jgi:hypothetical protein